VTRGPGEIDACGLLHVTEAELVSKMQDAEAAYNEAVEASQERASRLEEALFVGENFQQVMSELMQALRTVQDNLLSQDAPGADTTTLQQQLNELQVRTGTRITGTRTTGTRATGTRTTGTVLA